MSRKKFNYEYTIYTVPDEEIYRKQCEAIERYIPDLRKEKELHDVDDSRIQIYWHGKNEIRVLNDYYIGGVFVESDFDLIPFFDK